MDTAINSQQVPHPVLSSGRRATSADPKSSFHGRNVKLQKVESFFAKIGATINKGLQSFGALCHRVISVILTPVIWLAENRFGLTKLAGLMLVPSQLDALCNSEKCAKLINALCKVEFKDGRSYRQIDVEDGSTKLKAVICYPPGWNHQDNPTSNCIVFNNPNGMVTGQLFNPEGKFWCDMLPGYLQKQRHCPVIIYDYSGTGLNKTPSSPWPTGDTIIRDGCAVLKYAAKHFGHIENTGTSLGGGVATVSLEKLVSEGMLEEKRANLISHDSFTSIPRVVMPRCHAFADFLGLLVGGTVNAERSMNKLIDRSVSVKVLNNKKDHVIRDGARMSGFASCYAKRLNVSVYESAEGQGHMALPYKFREALKDPA
ncbi:hypothetical protein [Endozoicomonas ascidiicola]|uniref:hypothetical protein n=1 Tax=Endozoicomonas ascidiicola TaxID=1698521 RepID=UPI000830E2C4|nr:hypothetical protein [Endozoicomonas ascidiicola]